MCFPLFSSHSSISVQPQYVVLQPQQTSQQSSKQLSSPQIYLASSSSAPTQTQTWYPDSGASHHVTNMSQNTQQVTPFEGPNQITIGNG